MEIVVTMPAIFCHMFMVILFRILNRHGIAVEGSGGQTVVHLGVSTGNAVAAVPSQDAMVSALKNTLKLTSIAIARTRADNLLSHLSIRLHVQLTFLY